VKAIHKKGKRIAVFGPDLNDIEMQKFCVKIGVDFLVTDRPDLMRQVIEDHNEQKKNEPVTDVVEDSNRSCSIM
jgi:UDP-N-acetylmuramoylalanine-D-glutamate ligase